MHRDEKKQYLVIYMSPQMVTYHHTIQQNTKQKHCICEEGTVTNLIA